MNCSYLIMFFFSLEGGGFHQFLQRHPALEIHRHHVQVKGKYVIVLKSCTRCAQTKFIFKFTDSSSPALSAVTASQHLYVLL